MSKIQQQTAPGKVPAWASASVAPAQPTRIPETWLTATEQRLYAVALLGGMQIYKLSDVLFYLVQTTVASSSPTPISRPLRILQLLPYNWLTSYLSLENHYLLKWLWWDAVVVVGIAWLRIPGLRYGSGRMTVYLSVLWLLDAVLMGKFQIWPAALQILTIGFRFALNPFGKVTTLSDHSVRPNDVIRADDHLLGSLTLKMQPAGIAQFNPTGATFCIPPDQSGQPVFIPIIVNSSNPDVIRYSLRSIESGTREVTSWEGAIPSSQLVRPKASTLVRHRQEAAYDDDDDGEHLIEYGDVDASSDAASEGINRQASIKPGDMISSLPHELEPTQQIYFLSVTKTGHVDLLRITDDDGIDFKIRRTPGALVVECPSEGGVIVSNESALGRRMKQDEKMEQRCVGSEDVVEMQVKGVGTLSVGWRIEEIGGRRTVEEGLIEGIESPEDASPMEGLSTDQQLVLRDKSRPALLNPLSANLHTVSLPISHTRAGRYDVVLHTIVDSFNNVFHPPREASMRSFQVFDRPQISFSSACSASQPLQLLEGGEVSLLLVPTGKASSEELTAKLSFRAIDAGRGDNWVKEVKVSGKETVIKASQPGIYSLDDVRGPVCPGTVVEPASCLVKIVPRPHVVVSMTRLPGCNGDVGMHATFEITGTPPFVIHYERKKEQDGRIIRGSKQFNGIRGEIDLTPETAGKYTYTFNTIDDSKYKGVPLSAEPFTQIVHPEASIKVVSPPRRDIWSCATNETDVQFNIDGTAPFIIEYSISWPGGAEVKTHSATRSERQKIDIQVPTGLRDQALGGGIFNVEILRVQDGNGCDKTFTNQKVAFEVKSTRPTVRFGTISGKSSLSLAEGAAAKLPIHLTGQAPWNARMRGPDGQIRDLRLTSLNDQVDVKMAGVYEMVEVSDMHCKGSVVPEENRFNIDYIARPQLDLASQDFKSSKGSVYQREAICSGVEDHLILSVQGHGPFNVPYRHTHETDNWHKDTSVQSLRFAQDHGALHLSSIPGKHTYEILAVGDHAYPLSGDGKYNKMPLYTIQQRVNLRPRATVESPKRPSLCLNDSLKKGSAEGSVVHLQGEAPFSLDIEILPPGSRKPRRHVINDISSHNWHIALPKHIFGVPGTHRLSVTGVRDASGCAAEVSEDDVVSMDIDVVEPASIVAVDRREHHCVGDMLDFVLQGTSPWTVTYVWNGKTRKTAVKTSSFSRLADKPGVFSISSVAHQQNQCLAPVTDIERIVHPIPSAKVKEGNTLVQNLHEGDQVDIIFTFEGTPPFTFTYVRSMPTGKKGAMKVQETLTIPDIMEKTYTIMASTEGEYHITYIADAFCSYPPNAQSGTGNAGQKLITM